MRENLLFSVYPQKRQKPAWKFAKSDQRFCFSLNGAKCEISIFYLVSVSEQDCWNMTLLETSKTGCLVTRPTYYKMDISLVMFGLL